MVENVPPAQVWEALQKEPKAQLVDVRTDAEWNFIGVPDLASAGKQAVLVSWQVYPSMQHNAAFADQLKEAGVTVIYVGGYHTESALIIRQAKEQGMKATLVGGDALVTNEFWQIAGDAGAGTMMTFPPDPMTSISWFGGGS